MSNILVVGGAGYLGGAVTDAINGAAEVRVYDRLLYEDAYLKPIEFYLGDVLDHEALKPHLDWADTVIWLAAIVGDEACGLNPRLTERINEEAVEWFAGEFDGRIIFVSTCSVYGAADELLDEEAGLHPLSLYAMGKIRAEHQFVGKNALVLRLGTLFGVGDTFSRVRMDLVVNLLSARAYVERRIAVFGGTQYRPMLHVKDAAETIADSVESDTAGVFNLTMMNLQIGELGERLKVLFPGLVVDTTKAKVQDERNYRVSSAKAHDEFGFTPERGLDDGIGEVVELLRTGRIKDYTLSRYSNFQHLRRIPEFGGLAD